MQAACLPGAMHHELYRASFTSGTCRLHNTTLPSQPPDVLPGPPNLGRAIATAAASRQSPLSGWRSHPKHYYYPYPYTTISWRSYSYPYWLETILYRGPSYSKECTQLNRKLAPSQAQLCPPNGRAPPSGANAGTPPGTQSDNFSHLPPFLRRAGRATLHF